MNERVFGAIVICSSRLSVDNPNCHEERKSSCLPFPRGVPSSDLQVVLVEETVGKVAPNESKMSTFT